MATTGSGQPTMSGVGTTDWSDTAQQSASDRRAAGASGGIAQMVRDTTYQRLGDQKERASDTLGTVAGAVRGVTQQLRDGGQEQIADYANRAADGLERWATELRQQDIQDALRGVQRFARREPAMFLGIAFGVGVLAARFLKSSSEDGQSYSDTGGSRWNSTMQPTPMPLSSTGTSGLSPSGMSSASSIGTSSPSTTGTSTSAAGTSSPSAIPSASPSSSGVTPASPASKIAGPDAVPRIGSDVRSSREAL